MNDTMPAPVCATFAGNFPRPVLETLSLISNLCQREGYCYARNRWLAAARGLSESAISRHVAQLVRAGLFHFRRVGNERHLFPGKPLAKTPAFAPTRRLPGAPPLPAPHAGATESLTKENKKTKENKQQIAPAVTDKLAVSELGSVVVSSSNDFRQDAPIDAETISAPADLKTSDKKLSDGPETKQAESKEPVKDSPCPVLCAELEAVGVIAPVAAKLARESPLRVRIALDALPRLIGIKNAAAWLVAAVRDGYDFRANPAEQTMAGAVADSYDGAARRAREAAARQDTGETDAARRAMLVNWRKRKI